MVKASLAVILETLRAADSFWIMSHANPDGDAIGSMLAMEALLRNLGKSRVTCVSDEPVPKRYEWLKGAERIAKSEHVQGEVDCAVILDVCRHDRLGASKALLERASKIVVIDHHLDEWPQGDLVFIDPTYGAVGEIVADLFAVAGVRVTVEMAEAAYVAVVTDTGGFRYANTTPRCHRIAADLIEAGVDVAEISTQVFDGISAPKFELLRRTLGRMQVEMGGRLAYTMMTLKDIEQTGASADDSDGLVNYARDIDGVQAGMLFREAKPDVTKVSMRSRPSINSAQFLAQFGGGGHAGAAGATLEMPLVNATRKVVEAARSLFASPETMDGDDSESER